jgi:hypothetical protein
MTQEHLSAILETISAKLDKDGWSTFPDGRALTFYAGHDGVQLSIPRVEAVAVVKGSLVRARTVKGEIYVVALEDVFAAAVEAAPTQSRKAGFL